MRPFVTSEAPVGGNRGGTTMRTLRTISLLLVIIGALNWLLVGLFEFDLVAAITGNDFGEKNGVSTVIYVLVGLVGLALLPSLFVSPPARNDLDGRPTADVRRDGPVR